MYVNTLVVVEWLTMSVVVRFIQFMLCVNHNRLSTKKDILIENSNYTPYIPLQIH